MPRPKRAAAARAVAQLVSRVANNRATHDDTNDDDDAAAQDRSAAAASPTASTPTRPLRRVPLRNARAGSRDLARRRGIYERIAQHHVTAARACTPAERAAVAAELHAGADDDSDADADDAAPSGQPDPSPNAQPSTSDASATQPSASPSASPPPPLPLRPRRAAPPLVGRSVVSVLSNEARAPARMHALLQQLQSVLNRRDPAPDAGDPAAESGPCGARRHEPRHTDDGDDLRAVAERLATPRFMSHASGAVRLLTACSLAEVFRVAAPDPPLEPRKLNPVCSLFIEQLAVLVAPADGLELFRFSLLEQLATVQTLVIFSDDQDVVANVFACFYAVSRAHQPPTVRQYFADILVSLLEEAETLEKDVLDALLAPLVPALGYAEPAVALAEKVVADAAKTLQVPLSNMFNASIRALRGTHVAASPAKRATGRRKSPAKRAADPPVGVDLDDLSEHHDHLTDLLIAVNRAAPDVLIYVLPNLEDRLRSPDVPVRLGAVSLLARLFTTRANMARSYASLYSEFLARHIDSAPDIRAELVTAMGELLVMPHAQVEHLDKMLYDRLLDFDEKVRIATVRAVGKAGDHCSDNTIHRLVTRVQDRKAPVRSEALSQVILLCTETRKAHAPRARAVNGGIFEPQDSIDLSLELGHDSSGPVPRRPQDSGAQRQPLHAQSQDSALEERMARWSFLPNTLLEAHMALRSAGDFITAAEIEKIIFERICQPVLRSDDPDTVRLGLRRFSIFLAHLNVSAFSTFRVLVNERARARRALKEISRLRLLVRTQDKEKEKEKERENEADKEREPEKEKEKEKEYAENDANRENTGKPPRPWPGSKTTPSHGHIEEAAALARRFSVLFHGLAGSSGNAQDMCRTLATSVDLNVYKNFAKAVEGDLANADYDGVAQDAVSRIGSKTAAGKLLQAYVLPKCRPGVMSSASINIACELATSEASNARAAPASDDTAEPNATQDPSFLLSGLLRLLEVLRRYSADSLRSCTTSIRRLTNIKPRENDYTADVVVCGLRLACAIPEQWRENVTRGDVWDGLLAHIFNERVMNSRHAAKLAKWSTRLAIVTCADEAEQPALESLCRRVTNVFESFTGHIEATVAPVAAISQLAKHAPTVFKKFALQVFDFMRTLLSGSFNGLIEFPARDVGSNETSTPGENSATNDAADAAPKVELLCRDAPDFPHHHIVDPRWRCVADLLARAVKALVYSLEHVDMREEFANVVSVLVTGLDKGDVLDLSKTASSEEDDSEDNQSLEKRKARSVSAVYRLRAACGLIFLAKHRLFFREFTPTMMCSTVFAAYDKDAGTRTGFVRYVYNGIIRKRLPLRWVVSLALMAGDAKADHVAKVKSMLIHVFHQRRLVFEKARREGKTASSQLLPEVTITDLIWILAHQRNVEKDQDAGFPEASKSLELMLSCLLDSKDYEGLVNEYIESVTMAEDATESVDGGSRVNTERMVELGQIAGNILKKKQAGKKWVLGEQPSKIMLPRDFYRVPDRQEEVSGVTRPSIVDVARKYDVMDGKSVAPIIEAQPADKVVSRSAAPLSLADRGKRMRRLHLPDEEDGAADQQESDSGEAGQQGVQGTTTSEDNQSISSVQNSTPGRGTKRKIPAPAKRAGASKETVEESTSQMGDRMEIDEDADKSRSGDTRVEGEEAEQAGECVATSGRKAVKRSRTARAAPPSPIESVRPLRRSNRVRK